jgi:hypothetical protein
MLADFSLRLACGLVACLLILPSQVGARFYRVHFLTVLGLAVVAVLTLGDSWPNYWLPVLLLLLPFVGSVAWTLQMDRIGRLLTVATTVTFGIALCLMQGEAASSGMGGCGPALGAIGSAFLLGAATTAMLMGHSYLIAPTMSLAPLMRLLATLGVSVLARASIASVALWFWTCQHSLGTLNEVTMLLPVRWGLGLLGPAILTVLAWQTARIRSTQSATGILYVVVIFCFLGEVMGQLLQRITGMAAL